MKITSADVTYISTLAHLELKDEETKAMVRDLNAILGHIEALDALDTTGVPPMAAVTVAGVGEATPEAQTEGQGTNLAFDLRPDAPRPSLPHDEAMANAPVGDADFFKVPKVIER